MGGEEGGKKDRRELRASNARRARPRNNSESLSIAREVDCPACYPKELGVGLCVWKSKSEEITGLLSRQLTA